MRRCINLVCHKLWASDLPGFSGKILKGLSVKMREVRGSVLLVSSYAAALRRYCHFGCLLSGCDLSVDHRRRDVVCSRCDLADVWIAVHVRIRASGFVE